ncbi:MAG: methionyl-tRNA formyltransferase [Clostridium sp.]|nr:methionyl-tRNA formyltransferase [Clostridium sp.]MCM1444728.1 methionyl-tRNA formyltransferase [Candidatus Amulumruptor caecigallinarius]
MNLEDLEVKKEVKIVFMGTPDFAVPILQGLIDNYKVRAIITQPDRQVGRDGKVIFNPIKKLGLQNTILVVQPEKIKNDIETIKNLEPDLIVTCAYGQILPDEILEIPRLGCINVHASLLPKLRGGAPIHRAIMNGYKKTGITIMYMDSKMDEGDIISQEEIEIDINDTVEILHDKLSILGKNLLLKTLPDIINGTNSRTKQDSSLATYGFVIKREDEKIDFTKSKREIYNQVRGLNSWPGAYAVFESKILKIWECYETNNFFPDLIDGQITTVYKDGIGVKVSNGEIVLTIVQPEGKGKMKAVDYARGLQNKENIVGKILS